MVYCTVSVQRTEEEYPLAIRQLQGSLGKRRSSTFDDEDENLTKKVTKAALVSQLIVVDGGEG